MDLNKHIVVNEKSSPFHSSGIAVLASGDRLGSTSTVTFNRRQQIEHNRKVIKSYRNSAIGNTRGTLNTNTTDSKEKPDRKKIQIPERQTLQQYNSAGDNQIHFKEPPSRNYNPYA